MKSRYLYARTPPGGLPRLDLHPEETKMLFVDQFQVHFGNQLWERLASLLLHLSQLFLQVIAIRRLRVLRSLHLYQGQPHRLLLLHLSSSRVIHKQFEGAFILFTLLSFLLVDLIQQSNISYMSDIGAVRGQILEKYKELCRKISHEPNASFVRNFAALPAKSFYLDLVFRGNDKLNFSNRFTDRDLILLTSALESHEKLIRHVDFSFNELTDVGLEIFAKFVERCPNLESLNLQGNAFGAPSAELLSAGLAQSDSLKYLNLQFNKVGTAGAISITKNLLFASSEEQGRSLEELNLGDTGLDIDGVICVTSVLNWNNSSLRALNLDAPEYKSIGQECAIHFAKMLQVNRGLEKLSLRKNQLTCDAIYTIKQLCLQNNRLRVLDLAANRIAFKGAEAIHDILTSKFCVLESLNLAANRLGHYGAKAISQALAKNRTLVHLDLTRNGIDDNGLKMLAESLQTNDSLVSLKLYYNDFGQQSLREFHKLAKRMEKVTTYWDFTTYVVDNEIQMAEIDNKIKYDVEVSKKYYC